VGPGALPQELERPVAAADEEDRPPPRQYARVMRSLFCFSFLTITGTVACLLACTSTSDSSSSSSSSGGTSSGGTSSSSSGGAAAPEKMSRTDETIDVDGTSRKYILSVPKSYVATRKYPLVLALHGDGQDAASFVSFLGLEPVAGDDVIIAYADHSEDLFTPYEENNDQKLIAAILPAVSSKRSIDAAKIWGVGYSKGGYQLNQIACRKPGLLKAIAVHAGGAPQDRDGEDAISCPSAVGLPAFVTHGANDEPSGGEYAADYWAGLAGCGSTRKATTPTICQAYDGCPKDKPVVFCVVPNQPHFPIYAAAGEHTWGWLKTL